MEDQFEKFVKDHSSEMDFLEVPEGTWENIRKERDKDRGKKSARVVYITALRRIAAVLVLALAGYGMFSIFTLKQGGNVGQPEVALPAEIREMDQYYETQIANSWNELKEQHPNNELVSQEVSAELEMLNEEKEKLIEELKENFANQKVVEELIQIYRLRLEILEDVLSTLNEVNENDYEEEHEDDSEFNT